MDVHSRPETIDEVTWQLHDDEVSGPVVVLRLRDFTGAALWSLHCEMADLDRLIATAKAARRALRVQIAAVHPSNPGEVGGA